MYIRSGESMKLLEDRIVSEGTVLPGNIVKVGSFLNHQIDVELLLSMGEEVQRLFAHDGVTKLLTVEASGIAIATAFAVKLSVPLVFAKKYKTSNVSGEVYSAKVHSYTHNNDYNMTVEKRYISPTDRILIVDDFLANGEAIKGLKQITEDAGAILTGCVVAIEKGFQHGGDKLRAEGIRIESLALIDSIDDGKISFRR